MTAFITPLLFMVASCVNHPPKSTLSANYNLNSTLWIQTSSEYRAISIQTFNSARRELRLAIENNVAEKVSTLPFGIIMDIDESVLDNSQYQAKLILNNRNYDADSWDKWISLKVAPPVPGAVDFINYAVDMGVQVIFITNRKCRTRINGGASCPQKQETLQNLSDVGILGLLAKNLLLKSERPEWTSEKENRRQDIYSKYHIIMLFGDDLGDFLPGVKKNITANQRKKLVLENKEKWGITWFMLSNPTYGSWERVLPEPKHSNLNGY